MVLNAFQAVGFYGFTNWAPTFLAARGVHFAQSLQYGFIIAVAYPIGPLIWSTVAERFERKWLVVAAAAGTGLLGLAFAAQSAPALLIALGVAINFSNNLLSFSYHAYQAELYPTRVRATAVGFVYSWSRLSTVGSSYVIAWLLGLGGAPGRVRLHRRGDGGGGGLGEPVRPADAGPGAGGDRAMRGSIRLAGASGPVDPPVDHEPLDLLQERPSRGRSSTMRCAIQTAEPFAAAAGLAAWDPRRHPDTTARPAPTSPARLKREAAAPGSRWSSAT